MPLEGWIKEAPQWLCAALDEHDGEPETQESQDADEHPNLLGFV